MSQKNNVCGGVGSCMHACVCVRVCVGRACVCACACVRACVRACARARACVCDRFFTVNCIECFYVNDDPESKFLYTQTIKLYCIV